MSIFSQDNNTFSYFISQNEELSNSIYNSIVEIFQSNLLTLASELENRVIKYFIHENNILFFDSIDDNINVHLTQIKNELTHNNILKHLDIDYIKKHNSMDLHFELLFKMNSSFTNSLKFKNTMSEFFDLMISRDNVDPDKIKFLKDYTISDYHKFELRENLYNFFILINFLNTYANLNFKFNQSFIEQTCSFFNKIHKDKFDTFYSDLSNILKVCEAKDFRDYTNSFEHNDSDSHVWITPYNNIIISEQNVIFLCQFLNEKNINVYYIQPASYEDCIEYQENFKDSLSYEDYIILLLESDIQNNQVDNLKNLAFSLTNKEFSFINPLIFNWFNTYLPYSLYEISKYALSSNKYL